MTVMLETYQDILMKDNSHLEMKFLTCDMLEDAPHSRLPKAEFSTTGFLKGRCLSTYCVGVMKNFRTA